MDGVADGVVPWLALLPSRGDGVPWGCTDPRAPEPEGDLLGLLPVTAPTAPVSWGDATAPVYTACGDRTVRAGPSCVMGVVSQHPIASTLLPHEEVE